MHTGQGPKYLGSHPSSATYQLCDFGQVTKPPSALSSPSLNVIMAVPRVKMLKVELGA